MIEHDLERDSPHAGIERRVHPAKRYAALATDAARSALSAKVRANDLVVLLAAIGRLNTDNLLVTELAEVAGRIADDLQNEMDENRTRYVAEADRDDS